MGKKKGGSVARAPEVTIRVRNSERGTMDKCPQRWWWSWREGLQPKETAKALWFGTGIHNALADYYQPGKKRSKDFIDVWDAYATEEANYVRATVGALDEPVWVEAKELGRAMLLGYVEKYQGDKHWDVIATEQAFELEMAMRWDSVHPAIAELLQPKYGDTFFLNGTFDGVYYDIKEKKFKLMEHKTAASISVGHLPVDNQSGTYWLVAALVGKRQGWLPAKGNISEITYNFLRKGLPDERPKDFEGYALNKPGKQAYIDALVGAGYEFEVGVRGGVKYPTVEVMEGLSSERGLVVLGERSKVQPAPLFERHPSKRTASQRVMMMHRLQAEVVKMLMYREGILEITKSSGRDTCAFCQFKEMCELHESGGDWEGFRDAMYRSKDPYSDHRKSAGMTS